MLGLSWAKLKILTFGSKIHEEEKIARRTTGAKLLQVIASYWKSLQAMAGYCKVLQAVSYTHLTLPTILLV